MKKWFLLALPQLLIAEAVVTYRSECGRFGDNLLMYLHTKWISYKYDVPIQCNYDECEFFSELVLYKRESNYYKTSHPTTHLVLSRIHPEPKQHEQITYIVPYFPEVKWELAAATAWDHLFDVDWQDPQFRKLALEMIAPTRKLSLALPPPGTISIAIHVREGGRHDPESIRFVVPLKIPPLQYYVDSLERVVRLLPKQPLYCYVFTDAVYPKACEIVKMLKQALPSDVAIEFHYHRDDNHDRINVLEDFFSLFHYDILIRSTSNFSMVPNFLHDYAIVTSPEAFTIHETLEGRRVTIDEIDLQINQELYKKITDPQND